MFLLLLYFGLVSYKWAYSQLDTHIKINKISDYAELRTFNSLVFIYYWKYSLGPLNKEAYLKITGLRVKVF